MQKNSKKVKLTKRMKRKVIMFFIRIAFISIAILSVGSVMNKIKETSEKNIDTIASTDIIETSNLKEIKFEDIFPHHAKVNKLKKLAYISDNDITAMISEIKQYLGDDIKNTSLCYYDINTGKSFNINEKIELKAASTVKVPVSMMLYTAINNGKISEKDTMVFKQGDYEESYAGIGYEDVSIPKTFEHINESMIVYSDNVAVNMLLRYFGKDKRYDYIQSLVGHEVNRNGNYSTAEDSMNILKTLYANPENNQYFNKIIELMKKTAFHERLDKFLPKDIVAHKIGDYGDSTGNYVHDVGIIYTKQPYILVVMTKNLKNSYDKIAHISKIVYDIQTK